MLPIYRFLIAVVVINGLLNVAIQNLVVDSRLVPVMTALWMAVGYVRVFGRHMQTNTFKQAFQGVLMALAWPIMAKR